MWSFIQQSTTTLAAEKVAAMFAERTHAESVKVTFAIGTHGGFVIRVVPLQATLSSTVALVVELVVRSFAAAFWEDAFVEASSLSWSGRT